METSAAPAQDGSGEGWRITDAAGRRGRLVVRRFDLVWFVVILAMRLHRERGRKRGDDKKSALSIHAPTGGPSTGQYLSHGENAPSTGASCWMDRYKVCFEPCSVERRGKNVEGFRSGVV